jgi:hypothetical protein
MHPSLPSPREYARILARPENLSSLQAIGFSLYAENEIRNGFDLRGGETPHKWKSGKLKI